MQNHSKRLAYKMETLLEKQNGPMNKEKRDTFSMAGKTPKEMQPYLLSGEPDDLTMK